MAGITTHVLDTDRGRPVAGIRIALSMRDGAGWKPLASAVTNADGRTDTPILPGSGILPGSEAKVGEYQLEFAVADYLAERAGPAGAFVDDAVVRFSIFDVAQHHHVPLLCTPASCTTYRGS